MRGTKYTIFFAVSMSAICAVLLSGVYMLLKDRQDLNRALEQQVAVLLAAGVTIGDNSAVKQIYEQRVKTMVIDQRGQVLEDIAPDSLGDGEGPKNYALLYAIAKEDGIGELGYVYPIVGSGLWSKLHGYLAVTPSGKDILGITFYKQGETPGLGAEIEKAWFTDNFLGKTLFEDDRLVGVKVAKGSAKLDPTYKQNPDRVVDGISGATITGDGVSDMLMSGPQRYEPFFKNRRKN